MVYQGQKMTLELTTDRLLLRPFRPPDAAAFSDYRSDPAVAQYQGWDAPFSLEDADQFIAHMESVVPASPGNWYQLAIQKKGDSVLIGDCAFCVRAEDGQQARIGYTLARPHQDRGYATEAVSRLLAYLFEEIGLHRVTALCDVENSASFRLLERLGMRREAHFIENAWFKNRWSSEYEYALLAREWPTSPYGPALT
jgi:aminoglycoside 6'-N-acetyltransferase